MQLDPKKINFLTLFLKLAFIKFICICKLSLINSAGKLVFALMPPTLAAAIITPSGFLDLKNF